MKLRTQLALGYAVVFGLIIVMTGVMYWTTSLLIGSQDLANHSYQVINDARLLQKTLVDIQSEKRGFLITGLKEYLQPFQEGKRLQENQIEKLKKLVKDNPQQVEHLENIETMIHRWLQVVALPQIEERWKANKGEASMENIVEKIKSEQIGRGIFEDIRDNYNTFIGVERARLADREKTIRESSRKSTWFVIFGTCLAIAVGIAAAWYTSRAVLRQIGGEPAAIAGTADVIARGNLDVEIHEDALGSSGIGAAMTVMLASLRENRDQAQRRDWIKTGITRLNEVMSGDPDLNTLASQVISEVTTYLDSQVGALYVLQNGQKPTLSLLASYAYTKRKNLSNIFKLGEGLVGQAALEKQQILVKNVPEDYIKVTSGLGERIPRFICVTPFLYEDKIKGVIEIGTLNQMTETQMEYLAQAMPALALASKYKSQFLSNMSHELRTPLNSLLLLAQGLSQHKDGNLTAEQVESAKIIHSSGSDLLNLINEILDLSKIEAGRTELQLSTFRVADLAEGMRALFGHMFEEKGLYLEVEVIEDTPTEITSDRNRVEQVVRNLVSNAVKFTERGGVTVTFTRPAPGTDLTRSGLAIGKCLGVAVEDTGIGIAPEQQKIIFEAFQQANGGTARKFGGTGLGLSISREIARILGGEIQLESEVGKGSTFTFYLPVKGGEAQSSKKGTRSEGEKHPRSEVVPTSIPDDRNSIGDDDRVILVIEDDPNFTSIILNKCYEKQFKCVAAPTGELGLELALKHPPSGVILDIRLPGMDGWAVLNALKEDTRTRHIPVHIISVEEASTESLRKGAVGHAVKPLAQQDLENIFSRFEEVSAGKPKRVLVVEDDQEIRRKTAKLIENGDIQVDEAGTAAEALEELRSRRYDCMVLDLGLPDMDGNELLAKMEHEGLKAPPVIVHTARDLTQDEEMVLREHAESIVIKDVRSQERLLDEVSLFLHQVVSRMPEKKRKIIKELYDTDELLRNKKVLVVDDDMRTTFAVSRLLSEHGMKPLKAENGERALRLLGEHPKVSLVLMDIMMPVMDGYEAMKRIRAQERFQSLPIIALTAKAMPEDREKCLAAGANDYLAKPVDAGRLISMMWVWLYR